MKLRVCKIHITVQAYKIIKVHFCATSITRPNHKYTAINQHFVTHTTKSWSTVSLLENLVIAIANPGYIYIIILSHYAPKPEGAITPAIFYCRTKTLTQKYSHSAFTQYTVTIMVASEKKSGKRKKNPRNKYWINKIKVSKFKKKYISLASFKAPVAYIGSVKF